MAEIVSLESAKTNLPRLIARVEAGEEIIIVRDTVPVARLVPITQVRPRRVFGAMRGKAGVTAEFFETLPEDERRGW
jgi:prevent-host-death family protein